MANYDLPDDENYSPQLSEEEINKQLLEILNTPITQADVDRLKARRESQWNAETPDGKSVYWNNIGLFGDNDVVAKVLSRVEMGELNLSHFMVLPSNSKNPYSVKLALELVYLGKGEIKYSGNVPNFEDILPKLNENGVE